MVYRFFAWKIIFNETNIFYRKEMVAIEKKKDDIFRSRARHGAAAQGVDHQPCGALQTPAPPLTSAPRSYARHRA